MKRILTIVLSLLILLAMMPLSAFATDPLWPAPELTLNANYDSDANKITVNVELGQCDTDLLSAL